MEVVDPRWRKSSFSGNGGDCVEVGEARFDVLVRDTQDRQGPTLVFSPAAWRRLTDRLKALADALGKRAGDSRFHAVLARPSFLVDGVSAGRRAAERSFCQKETKAPSWERRWAGPQAAAPSR